MNKTIVFYLLLVFSALSGCKQESVSASEAEPKTAESAEPFRVVDKPTVGVNQEPDTPIVNETTSDLEQQAIAIIKKTDADVEKFYVKTLVGDLDQDGKDDVVMEYGGGFEGAMHHVANQVVVLMQRPQGLILLPDEVAGGYCSDIYKIEKGKLYIDEREACMIPFAKTIGFYTYVWNGTAMVESKEMRIEQKIIDEILAIEKEIESDNSQAIEKRFTDELKRSLNDEKLDASNIKDAVNALSPIMLMRASNSPEPEKYPEDYAEANNEGVEYRLYLNYETAGLTTKINGENQKVSAIVTLKGMDEYVFHLANDKLYLLSQSETYIE